MGRFGPWEILIIVLLIVVLFKSAKIPGMMRNLAGGIKEFKKELKDDKSEKADASKKPAVKKATVKKSAVKKSVSEKSGARQTAVKKSAKRK